MGIPGRQCEWKSIRKDDVNFAGQELSLSRKHIHSSRRSPYLVSYRQAYWDLRLRGEQFSANILCISLEASS